jgi:hypothetical protein
MSQPGSTGTVRHMRSFAGPVIAVAVPLCLAVAGCHSATDAAATAPSAPSSSSTSSTSASAARIDACSMVSPQEISHLLGVTVPGVSTGTTPDHGDCTWTNAATDESVSIAIDNAGTAPNDVLPQPDPSTAAFTTPGPDGMRYLGGGGVEFAGGGRSNTVQVAVVALSTDQANAAAVNLAHEIAPQIPH